MEPGILAAIIGGVAAAVAGLFLWLGNKQSHGSIIAIKSKPANGNQNLPSKENWLRQFTVIINNNYANRKRDMQKQLQQLLNQRTAWNKSRIPALTLKKE